MSEYRFQCSNRRQNYTISLRFHDSIQMVSPLSQFFGFEKQRFKCALGTCILNDTERINQKMASLQSMMMVTIVVVVFVAAHNTITSMVRRSVVYSIRSAILSCHSMKPVHPQ